MPLSSRQTRYLGLGALVALIALAPSVRAEGETKETKKQKTDNAKTALNKVFKGRVIKIKKKTVFFRAYSLAFSQDGEYLVAGGCKKAAICKVNNNKLSNYENPEDYFILFRI